MSDTDSQVVTVEVTSSEDEKDVGGAAAPAASLRSESPSAGGHSTASLRSESPSARGHSTVRKGMRPVIGDGAVIGAHNELTAGARVWPGAQLGDTAIRFSSDR